MRVEHLLGRLAARQGEWHELGVAVRAQILEVNIRVPLGPALALVQQLAQLERQVEAAVARAKRELRRTRANAGPSEKSHEATVPCSIGGGT